MYVQLLIALSASLIIILLAKRHPFVAATLYLLALVYCVAFSNGRTGLGGVSIRLPMPFYNAISTHHYGLTTNRSVLNMVLFIPFGYLFPTLISAHYAQCSEQNRKIQADEVKRLYTSCWVVVGAGFLCSLIIETSQLFFKFGVFELDDLVKNMMGTAIGYMIWKRIGIKLYEQSVNKKSSDAHN